jgi:transcriptional regulator with XRE-family HTH domain
VTFICPDRIRAARQAAGLTQVEVAARLNVQQATVSHWETGRKSPTTANLVRLAFLLGVNVDTLIDEVAA